MVAQLGRLVRTAARISGLLASAALIAAVSHVNMAVAGIGGISGKGLPAAPVEGDQDDSNSDRSKSAMSVIQLQDAVAACKSEAEIRALARAAGYAVVIT
jgi:hypothetical protein